MTIDEGIGKPLGEQVMQAGIDFPCLLQTVVDQVPTASHRERMQLIQYGFRTLSQPGNPTHAQVRLRLRRADGSQVELDYTGQRTQIPHYSMPELKQHPARLAEWWQTAIDSLQPEILFQLTPSARSPTDYVFSV